MPHDTPRARWHRPNVPLHFVPSVYRLYRLYGLYGPYGLYRRTRAPFGPPMGGSPSSLVGSVSVGFVGLRFTVSPPSSPSAPRFVSFASLVSSGSRLRSTRGASFSKTVPAASMAASTLSLAPRSVPSVLLAWIRDRRGRASWRARFVAGFHGLARFASLRRRSSSRAFRDENWRHSDAQGGASVPGIGRRGGFPPVPSRPCEYARTWQSDARLDVASAPLLRRALASGCARVRPT